MAAVARAKATQDDTTGLRAYYAKLTREHQKHGRAIIESGLRPVDDTVYMERDHQIQRVKAQFPVPTLVR
jgi:hypothetical protein